MQTHGNLTPYTIYFDKYNRMRLFVTPSKNIPPHTNPFEYDIRLFLILVYWIFTLMNLSYQALLKKLQKINYNLVYMDALDKNVCRCLMHKRSY